MEKYNIIMHYEARKTKDQRQKLREKFSDKKKDEKKDDHGSVNHSTGWWQTGDQQADQKKQKPSGSFNIVKHSTEWWQKGDQEADKEKPRLNKLALLIICPQNDFLDGSLPVPGGKGALPIPGARGDFNRIAKMIGIYGHHIQDISVALDAHLSGNISLASSWDIVDKELIEKYGKGEYLVVNEDLLSPIQPKLHPKEDVGYGLGWAKYYVRALKVADKVQLKLWPDHCIVEFNKDTGAYEAVKTPKNNDGDVGGYFGHDVVQNVSDALDEWTKLKLQRRKGKKSGATKHKDAADVCYRRDYRDYRNIGLSRKTESYSAVLPEVYPALNGRSFDKGNPLLCFTYHFNPLLPFPISTTLSLDLKLTITIKMKITRKRITNMILWKTCTSGSTTVTTFWFVAR